MQKSITLKVNGNLWDPSYEMESNADVNWFINVVFFTFEVYTVISLFENHNHASEGISMK